MHNLEFTIPLEPRSKKNGSQILVNRKTGKRFVSPSKQYKEYQQNCGYFIPRIARPIDCQINIKAVYYMGTKRTVDITNLHNALHDILQHYKVIAGDDMRIVISTDGSRVRYDKERPRTEVTITEVHEITGFEK